MTALDARIGYLVIGLDGKILGWTECEAAAEELRRGWLDAGSDGCRVVRRGSVEGQAALVREGLM